MSEKPKLQSGFTLIELVITMAIAAILLLVAVPGFQSFQRNSQLSSLTNSLLVAINTAKAEAMKQNASAYVIPASGADWGSGWIVFVDKDRDQLYSESGDVTVMKQEALASYFSVSGNGTSSGTAPYLAFDSSGFSRKKDGSSPINLTLTIKRNDVSSATQNEEMRRIIIGKTGRARSCKPSSDLNCTATASN
ncbi:GspH/FimT family pseudopilin [Acidovorax sp. SUPP2825]|uniref:GspH/FimT family pseudopilin n=1 Tax=Acidovorax sp. SUPP2825 TaxID=2920879 RepID=UPI0023DE509D|nr:GspH/FimT family pseudopilin [Acidovorax sp. SUPP2825]GKS94261.1 GspH/FimT family pseudopilin [Acidovorax sp. SUPP2825]